MKKIKLLTLFASAYLLTLNASAFNLYIVHYPKVKINLSQSIDCSNVASLSLVSKTTLSYSGTNGYDGSLKNITIPSNAVCLKVTAYGSNGTAWGSSGAGLGDIVSGVLKLSNYNQLTAVVAGYSGAMGGGGLSGVFSGYPSSETALIVAGGGGGAGNVSKGYDALLTSPSQPTYKGSPGGDGFGGNGSGSTCTSFPQDFSTGAVSTTGSYATYSGSSFGAYGGGGGNCGQGMGGGSGIPGGYGSAKNTSTGNYESGGGGTSFCISNASCNENPHIGSHSGKIVLEFYK